MTIPDHNTNDRYVISYARLNRDRAERLFDNLKHADVPCWLDTHDIPVGRNWEISVRDAIRASRGVLLLATPESAQSQNVRDELAMAFANDLPIYPLWLAGERYEDCAHKGYEKLHAVDLRGNDYAAGLAHIIAMLTEQPPKPPMETPTAAPPRNPYMGLHAFRYEDRDKFFGRAGFVRDLLDKLRGQPANARLLAVVGASGSGKSSVVMAGLLPALPALRAGELEGGADWVTLDPFTPTAQPLEQLAIALNKGLPARSVAAIEKDLAQRSCRGLHRLAAQMVTPGKRVVLIVDQFEEMFTLCRDAQQREHFLNLLTIAATEPDGPLQVILTLRADFTDKALAHPALCALLQSGTAYVPPLALADLVDAIKRPADLPAAGLTFDDGLVSEIAFDVTDRAGALPLLQFALDELFRRRDGHRLTRAAYEAMRRIEGALAKRADAIYLALPLAQQPVARRIFLALVQLGEGSEDTRRRAQLDELLTGPAADEVRQVADSLARERLITLDRDQRGQPTLEVAHEALIQHWPRLREWLDANRDALRLKRQLEDDARAWVTLNRDEGALYRGAKLAQTDEWSAAHADEVLPSAGAFLEASREAAEREAAEREAARQRELAQAQALADVERKRTKDQVKANARLRQRFYMVLTAFAITAMAAGVAAWFAAQATQSARLARAQKWATLALQDDRPGPQHGLVRTAQSLALQPDDDTVRRLVFGTTSPLLRGRAYMVGTGVIGWTRIPSSDVVLIRYAERASELHDLVSGQTLAQLSGDVDVQYGVHFMADESAFVVSYRDDTMPSELWDVKTHTRTAQLSGAADDTSFVADGSAFVLSYRDGKMPSELWDVKTHTRTAILSGAAYVPGLEADGSVFVVIYRDDTMPSELWDVKTHTRTAILSGAVDVQYGMKFTADGSAFVVSYRDDTMPSELWDVKTHTRTAQLSGNAYVLDGSAIFTADGSAFVVSYRDGKTPSELWDVKTHTHTAQLSGDADVQYGVKFTADGSAFVVRYVDGKTPLELWDMKTHTRTAQLSGAVGEPKFTADGSAFVVGYSDGNRPSELWDVKTHTRTAQLSGDIGTPQFTADGSTFVMSYFNGRNELWDVKTHTRTAQLSGVAYVPGLEADGSVFVVIYRDDTMPSELWDAKTHTRTAILSGAVDVLDGMKFTADGSAFVVSYGDGNTLSELWDVKTHTRTAQLSGDADVQYGVKFTADGSAFVVRYLDGRTELWNFGYDPYRLSDMGLGVKATEINQRGNTALVRYSEGNAYLYNLDYLRQVRGDPAKLKPQDLIDIVCTRLKARPEWFTPAVMRVALDGEDPPAACLP